MKISVLFLLVMSIFCGVAVADTLCSSNVTSELGECARGNFKSADQYLNESYRRLAGKLAGDDKKMLLDAQRSWITYKEKICQGAYDATAPGEEAGIDKWTCLAEVTKTRARELQYLDSASGAADFVHAVEVVSKYYEGGDREKFVNKLADDALRNDDKNWSLYVMENCKLAASRLNEDKKECMARQSFYRY